MAWLLEWTYRGKKHYERIRDKRLAMRSRKNVLFIFPGATNIKVYEAKELSYSEMRRLERAMGIKE